MVDRNGYATVYEYDANGNRTAVRYANGIIVTYDYDLLNRLTCQKVLDIDGEVMVQYTYALGLAGERLSVTELDRTVEYTYDNLYRLTGETITEGEKVTTYTYAYDSVGNRILKNVDGQETVYSYNALNQLVSEGDITYEYDLNGNLVRVIGTGRSALYEYNSENKLVKATVQQGNNVVVETYTYDYAGNRTSKTTSTNGQVEYVKYLNDNSSLTNVLAELDSEGNVQVCYTIGADLISQERNGKTSFYLYNGHGSVTALANESGVVTDTYTYDAFGNLLDSTGNTKNCYLYCGEQFDSTTGLYYLRARYMDTSTGRFISQDSYAGDINDPVSLHKYLYANANPVMYSDPSGYYSMVACSTVWANVAEAESRTAVVAMRIFNSLITMIRAVEPVITAIGGFAYNSILPITAMAATGTVVSITFVCATKDCIKEKVASIVKEGGLEHTTDNSVYILAEQDDPANVRYVGRTCNVENRETAHGNNPLKRTNDKPWHFYTIFTGLNPKEARIYEQALISTYVADELKTNYEGKLGGNRINGINPIKFLDKEFLSDYGEAAKKFSELEFSFGESELLCLILEGGNV